VFGHELLRVEGVLRVEVLRVEVLRVEVLRVEVLRVLGLPQDQEERGVVARVPVSQTFHVVFHQKVLRVEGEMMMLWEVGVEPGPEAQRLGEAGLEPGALRWVLSMGEALWVLGLLQEGRGCARGLVAVRGCHQR